MDKKTLEEILQAVAAQDMTLNDALARIQPHGFVDLGHTKLDALRAARSGFPEIIYGEHKDPEALCEIVDAAVSKVGSVLVTRITEEQRVLLERRCKYLEFSPLGRVAVSYPDPDRGPVTRVSGTIAVVTAGTSDAAPAEEAGITARYLGMEVLRVTDVGVAGISRLFSALPELRKADVVVVLAGMEGALPSVVAGLVDSPVIAVPTSVGYGAAFNGITALLGMLVSCSPGVTVVNIDNGFGAALAAAKMIRKIRGERLSPPDLQDCESTP